MQSAIQVSELHFSYEPANEILKGLSFHIAGDESVGLIGANGAGKSTLLKLLVGLRLDFSGQIQIKETPVSKNTLAAIRRDVGYVFQDSDSQLFLSTVGEDVAFGPRNYGLPEDEVAALTEQALNAVGILPLRDKPVYKLSGGEKKLASIATILSMEPKIILMDEPSVGLDPRNRRNLISILNAMKGARLIASHDLDLISDTCRRVLLICDGQIIADGPAQDILHDQRLLEANGLELPLSLSFS